MREQVAGGAGKSQPREHPIHEFQREAQRAAAATHKLRHWKQSISRPAKVLPSHARKRNTASTGPSSCAGRCVTRQVARAASRKRKPGSELPHTVLALDVTPFGIWRRNALHKEWATSGRKSAPASPRWTAVRTTLRRPERIMNDFKAYASRHLNRMGLEDPGRKRWARHGSTRWLSKLPHVLAAIQSGRGSDWSPQVLHFCVARRLGPRRH